MATLRMAGFSGEIPRALPRLLPEAGAQIARDVKFERGGIMPVRQPGLAQAIGDPAVSTIYYDNGTWRTWTGVYNVVPGPTPNNRLYISRAGLSPQLMVDGTTYPLALPGPVAALSVASSGTADPDTQQAMVYTYTYVTSFGEESEPAPLSNEVLWSAGLTNTLSGFALSIAGRGVTKMRIYRSQTSALGDTSLYFIAERAISVADFADNVTSNPLQELLPSADYNPPPATLRGIIAMPNGMMAGFVGKDVYFSEPWHPHAWPEKYVLTVDFDIVGLGVFDHTLVILTKGSPYVATGLSPDAMAMDRVRANYPCIAARGIANCGDFVAYPSNEGLIAIGPNGANLVSDSLFTLDLWRNYQPSTFIASYYNGKYIASFQPLSGVGLSRGTLFIELREQQSFISRSAFYGKALYTEAGTGKLYFLGDSTVGDPDGIFEWDFAAGANRRGWWRSKKFVLPAPATYGCIMIEADGTTAGSDDFQADVLADGVVVASILAINRPARLPAGFLAQTWEVDVYTKLQVTAIRLASSPAELAQG